MTQRISLSQKLDLFQETWTPKIVGELNQQHVKLAKLAGPFEWHHHEGEDELFLVLEGRLLMELRDEQVERTEELDPGDMLIVPKGVEHRPVADPTASVLLFEPATTVNTGNRQVDSQRTVTELEHI
ncbi:MAG: cupin domain-containing protein [Acidobacteriota bacterium]